MLPGLGAEIGKVIVLGDNNRTLGCTEKYIEVLKTIQHLVVVDMLHKLLLLAIGYKTLDEASCLW